MKDFIQRLYELENFPIYLGIIIVILLIIFIIVYFLGKKDSKLDETKRLEKVTDDAFKETSVTEQVEVSVDEDINQINPFLVKKTAEISELSYPSIPIKTVDNNNELRAPEITLPEVSKIEEELRAPEINLPEEKEDELRAPEIVLPSINEIEKEEELRAPEINLPEEKEEELRAPEIVLPSVNEIEKEEELRAPEINLPEEDINTKIDRFTELANSIEQELKSMEKGPIFEDKEEPILPELKEETKRLDVYSSVYGPKKEVELTNDTTEIELPKLK